MAPRVAIFGAGIAGLSAAHELVERGFRVRVYEPTAPGPDEDICSVGGMARTQYSRVEVAVEELSRFPALPDNTAFIQSEPIPDGRQAFLDARVFFDRKSLKLSNAAKRTLDRLAVPFLRRSNARSIMVRGYADDPDFRPDFTALIGRSSKWRRIDYRRADKVADYLIEKGIDAERLIPVPLGYPGPGHTPQELSSVDFHIEEDLLPGEHGFRFFPSFYRHLFDTMGRIPISDDDAVMREDGRTVLANLVAPTSQGVAYENGRTVIVHRRAPRSVTEFVDQASGVLGATGVTPADTMQLQRAILRYATSCSARRKTYESQSWWDFLEAWRLSSAAQKHVERDPQTLVAMRARVSDARTMGNISIQLMMDQLYGGQQTDRTLRGPTTTAWLLPWRRYLIHQGVEFVRGRITKIDQSANRVVVIVALPDPNTNPADDTTWIETAIDLDFYVVATSAETAQWLVRDASKALGGCKACDKIANLDLGRPDTADPGGLVGHMSGIQFYFRAEVSFLFGHIVYADSDWGLSSIAQPQFWTTRLGWWSGFRGLISVDIGDWNRKSRVTGRTAWESTPCEIAKEVWRQIMATRQERDTEQPLYFHIDDNIEFDPETQRPKRNKTPLLINPAGTYSQRPGCPGKYHLHNGQLVFAGTYMQTLTRLTTMEAANESARHAVTAILDSAAFRGDVPKIYDPETYEPDDLRWLVDLDARLFKKKLPHALDIMGFDVFNSTTPDTELSGAKDR
jgi:uncharacterized protein with NAD-binding domain and iron-sulfur cluster/outer membrane protein OmpA-like peptidoglycan-associated protein